MRWLCVCSFIVLSYHAVVSSEPDCDASRNVTGVVGGEVTLYVDHTENGSISWVRVKDFKPIAETKPGSLIEDVISSYRGRLKATRNGSLVITHLTREDQGSYKARVQGISHCSHLSVYDQRYNSTLNDPKSSRNSSSEFLGRPQHLLTKVLPPVIIVLVVVTAILMFGYRQKLRPQHICLSGTTPRKDNEEGSVWKINDIYNIESSSHRPGSKNVKADALSRSFCVFQPPDTPPEPILLANIIVASLSANLASDIKATQHLAPGADTQR
ncbi:uncharacterized protein LOC122922219 isoform X2 [Bufo gargarizans]|uniref:uncharacterized protein LOC122922219 isoform X2 n=1 Tax=Bufo gargarizans TaxID=30331 RepID=UPI001CF5BEE8|nr:uncharacterized protein LOC122922219 isoform X2 [Bufo gargarizans]